jgi:hypothetical protein
MAVHSSDAINADAGRRSPGKAGAAVTGSGRLRLPAQASRHWPSRRAVTDLATRA